ncbi:metallophosphoesterase family protein [Paenibacillus piri]|uniref:Metallophosphoesterase n=1 Tax=Paenibacillus piri TaxID=2547395 RepID=A0A4R5KQD7_9BACL|nr:metallophosphoesterase [Paenibacillus piri]TDF97963.1 metallophosphoesterase [Paenibacillus piri]
MKLVIMGDLHYPGLPDGDEELKQARDTFFQEIIDTFMQAEGDYHISMGDLTNEGRPEELRAVYHAIKASTTHRNFIHILGNHDTISLAKTDITAITSGQRTHSIQTEQALLVFLDTTKEMNVEDFGGTVDTEQLEWLEKLIDASGNQPMLVFGHHPLPWTTRLSDKPMHRIDPECDLWSVLSKKQGEGYYFCGHNHVNSIVKKDRWHFIQTAAFLDILAFRMVELKDEKLKVSMLHVKNETWLQQAEFITGKMSHFKPTASAEGEQGDLNLEINLNGR